MKTIDMQGPPYVEQLIKHRETFMMYVNGEVFLPCHLARVKGVVKGYISERLGVIECEDINRRNVNVFFDVEDVLIFKEPLIEWERRHRCPLVGSFLSDCPSAWTPARWTLPEWRTSSTRQLSSWPALGLSRARSPCLADPAPTVSHWTSLTT